MNRLCRFSLQIAWWIELCRKSVILTGFPKRKSLFFRLNNTLIKKPDISDQVLRKEKSKTRVYFIRRPCGGVSGRYLWGCRALMHKMQFWFSGTHPEFALHVFLREFPEIGWFVLTAPTLPFDGDRLTLLRLYGQIFHPCR